MTHSVYQPAKGEDIYISWLRNANERSILEGALKERFKEWYPSSAIKKDHLSIIDVGCGRGSAAKKLFNVLEEKEINYQYIGIDPSENQLKKFRNEQSDYQKVRLIRSGIEEFDISGKFDLALNFSDELIICLGSPGMQGFFSLEDRITMVRENTKITPLIVDDLGEDHQFYWDWAKYVLNITGPVDVVVTGNDSVRDDFLKSHLPILLLPRYDQISGNEVRNRILRGDEKWRELVAPESERIIEGAVFYKKHKKYG